MDRWIERQPEGEYTKLWSTFFFFFLNQHDRIALLVCVCVCVDLFIVDMLTVSQRAKFTTCGDKRDMMR